MRLLDPSWILYVLALCSTAVWGTQPSQTPTESSLIPRFGNDLTDIVTWDPFSLSIFGQRLFILAGEFHPWRLPVPSLWRDILEKAKAGGLNTISIYQHWALNNPSEGVLDFDGFRSLEDILKLAQEVGLWVILRAGPYVNGETTGGGVPAWVATKNATLRTNDAAYTEAWTPYWDAVAKTAAPYQITEGGPVILMQIENEFDTGATRAAYMQLLEQRLRTNGIVIPTTHNNKGQRGYSYATGTGAVDVWGVDSYPGGTVCSGKYTSGVVTNYNAYRNASGNSEIPVFMPEFQGGWFDPWGSTTNYESCRAGTGPEFERVFYQALWAQAARMAGLYMYYGGTNWGGLAAPVVYSSYDYGAAIPENRMIGAKFNELKMQGLFLRSARDFRGTSFAPEVTTLASSNDVTTAKMINHATGAGFYIVRHNNSLSGETTKFTLNVSTSSGDLTIPSSGSGITLLGRDARTIVTDYKFGSTHVLYSTAAVLLSTTINDVDWLVVYGSPDADSIFEVAIMSSGTVKTTGDLSVDITKNGSSTLASFNIKPRGRALLTIANTRILVLDAELALSFSAPIIPASGGYGNFAEIGSNDTIIIGGPHLVRSAAISGKTLRLIGDVANQTMLEVYGLDPAWHVTWNGAEVDMSPSSLGSGALTGSLAGPTSAALTFKPPVLSSWRYKDSLPEISASYDDSNWILASATASNLNMPSYPRSAPYLLGEQDYGFAVGNVIWRGHFIAAGNETAVYLAVNGGPAFAASVYLNGVWLGSLTSWNSSDSDVKNGTFSFASKSLLVGQDNVVTVLKDNMGLNEASGSGGIKQARGIIGYGIVGGSSISHWRVQGNVGADKDYPDKVRGALNEGGLYGERIGWHLPGFDDAKWERRSPSQGLNAPGVGFFRTTFSLTPPNNHDIAMSFAINGGNSTRVQLYVNGWQMGKYAANIGPQHVFPVHEGILNYHGSNTVAVSLWAVGNQASDLKVDDITLRADVVLRGGVAVSRNNPPWETRLSA